MKKAGRFGKYGEEKRRQRAKVKLRAEARAGRDSIRTRKGRGKKDK